MDAGEVGAGQSVTALYEVELAPGAGDPALTVQVRYADPRTGKVRELAQPFTRAQFGRLVPLFSNDPDVQEFARLVAQAAALPR